MGQKNSLGVQQVAPEGNAVYVLEFSEMVTQGDHATKEVTSVEAKFPPVALLSHKQPMQCLMS